MKDIYTKSVHSLDNSNRLAYTVVRSHCARYSSRLFFNLLKGHYYYGRSPPARVFDYQPRGMVDLS